MTRIFVVALLCSRVSLLIALERSEEIINLCWERNSEGFLLHCLNLFFFRLHFEGEPRGEIVNH